MATPNKAARSASRRANRKTGMVYLRYGEFVGGKSVQWVLPAAKRYIPADITLP
jgi:hypothetical protein